MWWNTSHPYHSGPALASDALRGMLLYGDDHESWQLEDAKTYIGWANAETSPVMGVTTGPVFMVEALERQLPYCENNSHKVAECLDTKHRRGEVQHMAWATEREDGGRGFGFTGAHFHWNWADPNFRKLVLNAIAWCAKAEVPVEGVSDAPKTLADMEANHDERPPRRFDREEIRKQFHLPPDDVSAAN